MSYTINVLIPTGRPDDFAELAYLNYTSNVGPMWLRALTAVGEPSTLGDLIEAHGKTDAQKVRDLCARAAAHMLAHLDEFEAMNPENGWGNATGAREVLEQIAAALDGRPTAIVTVSR